MNKLLNDSKYKTLLSEHAIEWDFTTPLASHMGGVYERQIRTVRKLLRALMNDRVFTEEALTTIFCEIENIVNSRPLTVNSDDPNDPSPLTPNHLLKLECKHPIPISEISKVDRIKSTWKGIQYIVSEFWERWLREYLHDIRLRQNKIEKQYNFKIGDIVLLIDGTYMRNRYPLGRVTNVFTSADNLVRTVEVKTQNGTYVRPISKLVLLVS